MVEHNYKQHEIYDISKGVGGLKYYSYWVSNIKLTTKTAILEAINLGLSNIKRKDKITNKISVFDYKTLSFKEAV